jgi:AAA+ superfamily predicted ATPase
MPLQTSVHEIKTLIRSFHPVIAIESVEEQRVLGLVESVAEQLGMKLFQWSVTNGLRRSDGPHALNRTQSPQGLLKHIREMTVQAIFLLKDFSRHLDDAETCRLFRELAQSFAQSGATFVLTGQSLRLPKEIEHHAIYHELHLPDTDEIDRVVRSVLASLKKTHPVKIDANRTDYDALLSALRGLTLNQARQAVAYAVIEDGRLSAEDIGSVLERKVQLIREGGILEYYPLEDNRFELGGFGNLKRWLDRARVGFSEEAKKLNLGAPRGVLIVGVQGCGKSLAAKFIARQWNLPLLKLDAGRLFDKFIGESEKNFRRACDMAESMSPVVLWIDEIEKGMSTGGGDADGGLSRRLFGAFLTWLQEKKEEVFVVATANDLSVLPPELLRKGRFDEIFFVDLPDELERRDIFGIHLGLRKQSTESYDIDTLIAASVGFSGAEIEQAVIGGLYRALHRRVEPSTELLVEELGQTVPLSVSRREDIERLRETARNRFVSVK